MKLSRQTYFAVPIIDQALNLPIDRARRQCADCRSGEHRWQVDVRADAMYPDSFRVVWFACRCPDWGCDCSQHDVQVQQRARCIPRMREHGEWTVICDTRSRHAS